MKAVNVTHRRRFAAVTALVAASVLSACSYNFGAQTDQVYIPSQGVNNRDGKVDVLHALVVSATPGTGTVIAGLVNGDLATDDKLLSVTDAGNDPAVQVEISGDTTIPAGALLQLADAGGVQAVGDRIEPGNFVKLTFTFANGEAATLTVPVVAHAGDFADVPVAETR